MRRAAAPHPSKVLNQGITIYNVTIGIPVYIMLNKVIMAAWPVIA
jgi:hypothetical protein